MRKIFVILGAVAIAFMRRFLSGTPKNSYEQIMFNAGRAMAANWGRAVS